MAFFLSLFCFGDGMGWAWDGMDGRVILYPNKPTKRSMEGGTFSRLVVVGDEWILLFVLCVYVLRVCVSDCAVTASTIVYICGSEFLIREIFRIVRCQIVVPNPLIKS